MSIIYDALQKTQRNREYLKLQGALTSSHPKPPRRRLKSLFFTAVILVLSAAAGASVSLYMKNMSPAVKPKTIPPQAATKPQPLPPTPSPASLEGQHLWVTMDSTKNPAATTPPARSDSSAVPNNLILNGVLITGIDKIALINNQSFHVGDIVQGMKIVGIEFNRVKLQNGQEVVELQVPA